MGQKQSQLQDVRRQVVDSRDRKFNLEEQLVRQTCIKLHLEEEEINEISKLNVHELVARLNSGKLTSSQIVTSVCYKTSVIGLKLKLFTQTNFAQALEIAGYCDRIRKQTGKKNWTFACQEQYEDEKYLPPLFGIPVSIKDVYDMEGFLTTVGCTSGAFKAKKQDSPIISCFRNSGMIPFVRSNAPMLGMTFQTVNTIWGRSLNPWDETRTTGGSSGGQGGLISSGCSFIGLGSDIGGSIRIPAIFCGISALKPSPRRISNRYHEVAHESFWGFCTTIPNAVGPLGRCAEDLALLMKVATTQKFYEGTQDPLTKIVPFDDKVYRKVACEETKLRVGYLVSLKNLEPSIACSRALSEVKEILERKGYDLVEIEIPNERQIIQAFMEQFFADGGSVFRAMLDSEHLVGEYEGLFSIIDMWWPKRCLVGQIAQKFTPRIHDLVLSRSKAMNAFQYMTHMGQIQKYRQAWIKYWKGKNIDILIQPAFSMPALQHTKSKNLMTGVAYTFIWNVLEMAAGVVQVTTVRADEQTYNSRFNDPVTEDLKEAAAGSAGLPASIQVIGLPYQEQKVLGFMQMLQKEINFNREESMRLKKMQG